MERKIRVLFPKVEAGFGHIMTCVAVEEIFKKKYSDKVEIIDINFFDEAKAPALIRFGKFLKNSVKQYNKSPLYGHILGFNEKIWGKRLSLIGTMIVRVPGSWKRGVELMESYKPDVVFSTHWATNFYAEKMKEKPLTFLYCPDAHVDNLFKSPADYTLSVCEKGYLEAIQDKTYNSKNLKLVKSCIRNEAFDIYESKIESRKRLGLPENKFTIVLTDGGYGLGHTKNIVKRLLKDRVNATIVAICGTNEKLLNYFKNLQVTKEVTFRPLGFTEDIFYYLNAADLFCGKSGSMIGEPTFFGVPTLVTNTATIVESNNCKFYRDYVHCAIKEKNPKKAVRLIKRFIEEPEILKPYIKAAKGYHDSFGAEDTVDVLWREICLRFNLEKESNENVKKVEKNG